ncbi:MAG: hypothetical protein ACRD5J_16045 [Nitrososphaeraceae archaeon]
MKSIHSDYPCSSGIKMTNGLFKSIADDLLIGISQDKKSILPTVSDRREEE